MKLIFFIYAGEKSEASSQSTRTYELRRGKKEN